MCDTTVFFLIHSYKGENNVTDHVCPARNIVIYVLQKDGVEWLLLHHYSKKEKYFWEHIFTYYAAVIGFSRSCLCCCRHAWSPSDGDTKTGVSTKKKTFAKQKEGTREVQIITSSSITTAT